MLEIQGKRIQCCDGVTRRSFLKVGAMGLGGLSLAEVLRLRAEAGSSSRKTAVIFVELAGGPTHFETYDPKPDAPDEYRGPLGTVKTNVPGVLFSELMVEQARIMDKLAIIRSIHHDSSSHGTSSHLHQTGYYLANRQLRTNSSPCAGSVAAKLRGSNAVGVPAFVSMPQKMRFGGPAFLGKGFNPFVAGGDPNAKNFRVQNLSLVKGLSEQNLSDRRTLLASFDAKRQYLDLKGAADAIDAFNLQAFEMITGDASRKAFNIAAEDPKVRERYGRNATGQRFLLARRLVEAGVTFVTVRPDGSWDDHRGIEARMKQKGPNYDRAIAALISELYERGLDRDVMVVATGEFGRTPRINRNAGRDHWGRVQSVLMSGGGLKVGQIVGASNAKGEVPAEAPYRPENVLATVYRHLGINPIQTFADHSGRPRYILEERGLVTELT